MSKKTPRSIHNLKWLIVKNGCTDKVCLDILEDKYEHLYHFNNNEDAKKPEGRAKYFIHNDPFLSAVFDRLLKKAGIINE